jgi:hypothetical protein
MNLLKRIRKFIKIIKSRFIKDDEGNDFIYEDQHEEDNT